ncbi:hypothetical protein [Methylotenera sp.]|uniref:hypothetical protein n=1 Tax=Methylotenera sp. TaxID=2051956 RepID=UPI0024884CB8|nr:hypothetical protein [Methylotenera sp.]MDI1299774.1 hypothetical protein [Methylotenera sp.]
MNSSDSQLNGMNGIKDMLVTQLTNKGGLPFLFDVGQSDFDTTQGLSESRYKEASELKIKADSL